MSDELLLNGKNYVSSKVAAERTGYARDYIGQLSRGGLIDAERVGGLWYVSMESLQSYEKNAEIAKSVSLVSSATKEAESSLIFEGREYISASRASKVTGYNQDYVGQLARGAKVPSKQIGNRWYVDREALVNHKAEKDALLAAVQAESVGVQTSVIAPLVTPRRAQEHILVLPPLSYTHDSRDLIPLISEKNVLEEYPMIDLGEIRSEQRTHPAPEQNAQQKNIGKISVMPHNRVKRSRSRVTMTSVGVLTIVLVLSVGFVGLKGSSTFATVQSKFQSSGMGVAAANAAGGVGDVVEDVVSPQLRYNRGE